MLEIDALSASLSPILIPSILTLVPSTLLVRSTVRSVTNEVWTFEQTPLKVS